jgi:hypothetical protein
VHEVPQSETPPCHLRTPYGVAKLYGFLIVKNYRESYDVFACNGIRCFVPNCNTCNNINPYICAECKAGHALTPAFSCVQCPPGTTSTGGVGEASQCFPLITQPYKECNLHGNQVQPDAAMWLPSPNSAFRFEMPTLEQIKAVGDPLALQFPFPRESQAANVQELLDLALLRDDPSAVAKAGGDCPRLPLSRFLKLRPLPLGRRSVHCCDGDFSSAVLPNGSGDGESLVNPNGFPGTPRHPSYPSGHSVVGGAASEVLWAGIHFRPDREFGVALGRAVARIVLNQLPPRS